MCPCWWTALRWCSTGVCYKFLSAGNIFKECCTDLLLLVKLNWHYLLAYILFLVPSFSLASDCGTGAEDSEDGSGSVCERIPETRLSPLSPVIDCSGSEFGCCEDGATAALGPHRYGCKEVASPNDCSNQLYGCCSDGLTSALGPDLEGCPEVSTLSTLIRDNHGVLLLFLVTCYMVSSGAFKIFNFSIKCFNLKLQL